MRARPIVVRLDCSSDGIVSRLGGNGVGGGGGLAEVGTGVNVGSGVGVRVGVAVGGSCVGGAWGRGVT